MKKDNWITPKEKYNKCLQIIALANLVIIDNNGNDIKFVTAEMKSNKKYAGWQSTMKPSF